MAKETSENTETVRYFRATLKLWLQKQGLNQKEASERFDIQQSQINGFLNSTKGLSIAKIEKICRSMNKTFPESLIEGRQILGEEPRNTKPADNIFSMEQLEAIEDFKTAILEGGEGAEILISNARQLAEKKRSRQIYIKDAYSKSA